MLLRRRYNRCRHLQFRYVFFMAKPKLITLLLRISRPSENGQWPVAEVIETTEEKNGWQKQARPLLRFLLPDYVNINVFGA